MQALTFDIRSWRWIACKALGTLRREVYFSRLSGLRLREVPEPELPGPQWVRLRTILGGVCGTDLGLILQRNHPASLLRSFSSFPFVLGHENVAVIDQVGPAVTGWQVGQRVCVESSLSCSVRGITPPCRECQAGRFALCENFLDGHLPRGTMLGMNSFTGGSWAPYFVAHASQLHAVPERLSDSAAVLVDPLACALHGVLRHRPADDQRVLVQGGGIIGLGVVACLRALGCAAQVTALVRHAHQGEQMMEAGADECIVTPRSDSNARRYDRVATAVGGRRVPAGFGNQALLGGYHVVYDCVGTGASLTDAMKFTRPRGTTVLLGTSQITVVDTTPLWFSELTVLGAYGREMEQVDRRPARHTYRLVFDLMQSAKLKTARFPIQTYPLRDYQRALRAAASRGRTRAVKIAFAHPPA